MSASLNTRLLVASSVVLAAFLGATGLVLDNAFRASAESALRDRLQNQLYALLAATDVDDHGVLKLPAELPDPRLSQIDSGLYAEVVDASGQALWRSRSMLGLHIPFPKSPAVGKRSFVPVQAKNGARLMSLGFTVSWETRAGAGRLYGYRVAENLAAIETQMRRFRTNLWGWLGAAAMLLLVVQTAILRWSLAPLRQVANDLRAIESGFAQRLHGNYPRELRSLTDNLNALLESAESHLRRYRDSLGNLAHSLKTPLAVLRGALDGARDDATLRHTAQEQLTIMTQLIDYQLQRAAASGRASLATPVAVKPVVEKIIAALVKVYADKRIETQIEVDPALTFHGDEGDLTEMLGNVLDNACKWCRQRVGVHASQPENSAPQLELVIEDDGPGIPETERARILERGARADRTTPGHGLGLAMVADTVTLYRGSVHIENRPAGGLKVTLRFPLISA